MHNKGRILCFDVHVLRTFSRQILDYVGDEVWELGEEVCKLFIFVYIGSFMCSVFTLTMMALER